ncbi:tetratricopeptide repeat protein [bacterium]|nr:tetratricopeptide repeat protein [bacterium]
MNESLIWEKIGRLEQVFQSDMEDKNTLSELLTLYLQVENRWKAFNQMADQVLQRYPQDIPLLVLLFQGYASQNKTEEMNAVEVRLSSLQPVAKEDYRALVRYYQESKHDSEKALALLKQAYANHITDPELWMQHLSLLIEKKEYQSVLDLLTPAKLKELQDSELNFIRARLLINTQPKSISIGEEAEYLLLEALKKDASKVDAYTLLLEIYTSILSDHEKVVFLIKLASTNGLENLNFYKECLTSLLQLNEICEAAEIYDILEEYFPESEKLILKLVRVLHMTMNNLGSAKHIWAEYRKRKSIYQASLYLGCISVGESVWNELKSLGEREHDQESEWLFMDEATQNYVMDTIRQVILYSYDMLLLLDPDNPEFPFLKGLFLADTEIESAKHSYQQALAIHPGFTYARYELGTLYLQEGNWLEAYDHFKAVLDSPVYDVSLFTDVYMHLSEISIRFGWIAEAENYLDVAQSISPKDNRVHLSLGKIYLKESKIIGSEVALDKAEEHLRTATELNPENCEAIYYLGQVYYSKSQYLPAIKQYLLAIEKGLYTDRGESFATLSNCYLWISRSYFRLYKDMLFSSKDYLIEAIEYIRKIPVKDAEHPLLLEYMIELYQSAGMEEETESTRSTLKKKVIQLKPLPEISDCTPGMIKILTVFAPSITSEESEERAIFSKGNLGHIETIVEPGNAELIITGNIGESFRNSITVAYGFVKYFLQPYYPEILSEKMKIHVDIPGWFPKYDGPSAGVGIAVSMISALLKQPIPPTFTMTGEITLMGNIMPVGGIKEKIEATLEKNISRVYIPVDNRGDYLDMILKGLDEMHEYPEIVPVSNVENIVKQIFTFPDRKQN